MPKPHPYLDELLSYGGQPYTRAEIIAEMQSKSTPQLLIDRWLQGQELAARLRTRREHLRTRILLTPGTTTRRL